MLGGWIGAHSGEGAAQIPAEYPGNGLHLAGQISFSICVVLAAMELLTARVALLSDEVRTQVFTGAGSVPHDMLMDQPRQVRDGYVHEFTQTSKGMNPDVYVSSAIAFSSERIQCRAALVPSTTHSLLLRLCGYHRPTPPWYLGAEPGNFLQAVHEGCT